MPDPIVYFDRAEIEGSIPEPGYYLACVDSVKQYTSARGGETLHIVYELEELVPGWDRVSEYFVLSSPNLRAMAISQRRLLSLCRACGLQPEPGREVNLTRLVGLSLEVRLGHETFEQRKRLRVLGHRSLV
jgi:hypothetical protein